MGIVTDVIQDAIKTKEPVPDCVVLLAHNNFAEELASIWKANGARARVLMSRGRSPRMRYLKELSVWQFSAGSFIRLHTDSESTTTFDLDPSDLVRLGLGSLVEEHRAYQVAPSGHVFKHPSGRLTKHFFLASELVKDEVDVYFVALCICSAAWSQMSTTRTLSIDTMGIYPIARAIEEICTNGTASSTPWDIQSFHSHSGLETIYQSSGDAKTVLISASTSGGMAAGLAEQGIPSRSIITLLDATEDGRRGLVVHAHDRYVKDRYGEAFAIEVPSAEETAIDLTGEYFVAAGKRPRPLTLTIEHSPPDLKKLLDAFSAHGMCALNSARSQGGSTVDLISLNETRIADDEQFKAWVEDEIRLKTPVSVSHVVAMKSQGAIALATFCASRLQTYCGKQLEVIAQDDLASLVGSEVSGILVCAPLVGNGHALRVVARDLREVAPTASRHFLLGVGLPESEESWERLKQFLRRSNDPSRPYAISEWRHLPLGTKSGNANAWDRSKTLMERTEHSIPSKDIGWDEAIVAKSLELAGDELERDQTTFLRSPRGLDLQLTHGFVYWAASPDTLLAANHAAVAYMAMSATLQRAREFKVATMRLRSTLYETVVLDAENFLRFNDSPLQASILRAAHAFELDYSGAPETSLVIREFLEKVFLNAQRPYGDAGLEFAFALATKHLRITHSDLMTLIEAVKPLSTKPSALLGLLYLAWEAIAVPAT